ncbi:PH domain-containing protein (plasmid) [Halococcus dombrowskii]|uniref:PH domain-containing protein n=1 Tax=Halococcus dombrowskii TaxID=179637 RepID=A0AAV3SDE7_HALDO|nr:PH domain-containing protein [Halococcus dombrowskii]UOO97491.1 PH domain-containing protein [Halococcus dombrowskii]
MNSPDWLHLTDDEAVLWSGRPSLYTIAPGLLAGFVLAVVGLAFTAAFALSVAWLPAPLTDLPAWAPLVLVIGGAFYAGSEYLLLSQTRYVLTTEEVYRKDGLLRQNVSKIRHDRIQNTACDQSLVERLFSFGDITIYTAGTDTMEIRLTDVPQPQTVNGLLTEALDEAATQSSRRI